jgi:cell division protein FtsB
MWRIIFRKYRFFFLALILFLVLVTFLDKNNLLSSWRLRGEIKELEEQREFYLQKIAEDSLILENLKDPRFLEQYAREQFYMKRPGEEIYLVP